MCLPHLIIDEPGTVVQWTPFSLLAFWFPHHNEHAILPRPLGNWEGGACGNLVVMHGDHKTPIHGATF